MRKLVISSDSGWIIRPSGIVGPKDGRPAFLRGTLAPGGLTPRRME
jgi:hypothetical protein